MMLNCVTIIAASSEFLSYLLLFLHQTAHFLLMLLLGAGVVVVVPLSILYHCRLG